MASAAPRTLATSAGRQGAGGQRQPRALAGEAGRLGWKADVTSGRSAMARSVAAVARLNTSIGRRPGIAASLYGFAVLAHARLAGHPSSNP